MKRISLIKTLLVSLALCLALSCGFAINTSIAKADGANTFQMEVGASIRVDNATENAAHGIRFRAIMDESTKNSLSNDGVSFGFLIFPAAYLPEGADASTNYHNKEVIKDYVEIEGDTNKIYESSGKYYANAALVNIKEENITLDFTAVCYIKNGDTYTYTAPAAKRNVAGVASAAYIKDAEQRTALTSAFNALGTEELPIEITGINDFNAIASDVNKEENAETFSGVNFKLTQDVSVPENNTEIGKNFAGTIDGNNKTVSRRFTDHLLADASKLTNVKENLTVEGVEIKINDLKIYDTDWYQADGKGYNTNEDTGATLTAVDKNSVEETVGSAIGISEVTGETVYSATNTNGQGKGRYALYMNFNKDDVASLINAGYTKLSFKYAVYQSDSSKSTAINYNSPSKAYYYGDQQEVFPENDIKYTNLMGSTSFTTFDILLNSETLESVQKCFDSNGALRVFTIGGMSTARTVYFADFELYSPWIGNSINLLDNSGAVNALASDNTNKASYKSVDLVSKLKHGSTAEKEIENYSTLFGAYDCSTQFEKIELKLNLKKEQLNIVKGLGFNTLTLNILLTNAIYGGVAGDAAGSSTNYIVLKKPESSNILSDDLAFDGSDSNLVYGKWIKLSLNLDAVIEEMDENNCITLFASKTKSGLSQILYIGSLDLTKSAD